MQAKTQGRRCLPPIVRVFAPTRLTEQLLAGVYERLLCSDDRNGMTPVVGQAIDVEASAVLPAQFVTTGGPW
jgi:hypothetical protein